MNVKLGDLAIVVDDGGKYENVGLVVSVVSFEGNMDWYEFGEQPSWTTSDQYAMHKVHLNPEVLTTCVPSFENWRTA